MLTGPKTVVQGVASGKNAALEIDAYLKGEQKPVIEKPIKSYYALPGYNPLPVSLEHRVLRSVDHFPIPDFCFSIHGWFGADEAGI